MVERLTITLDRPITGHGADITQVVLREPVWRDVMKWGQPFTVHPGAEGGTVIIEDDEKLDAYASALIVEPAEYSLLQSQASVSDAFKVRNAIIGFFLLPATAGADSNSSQTNSSSSSDGAR